MDNCDVAVIGAGPYGLSIAAHLRETGVDFRIIGSPMEFWAKHMPEGMHLKSEGFASSLYDPWSAFTLKSFCKEKGLPYSDVGTPVPLEVFRSYGVEFQKKFASDVKNRKVDHLKSAGNEFQLTLDDGEIIYARRVVIAVGLAYYKFVPDELQGISDRFVTHSSRHADLEEFRNREIIVVGAGASAIDLAALLHQAGASVQVVARGGAFRFQDPPDSSRTSWVSRFHSPVTGIGVGWRLYLCATLPLVFRLMPVRFRIDRVRRILGPAPCWFTKDQVIGKVGLNTGLTIRGARVMGDRICLQVTNDAGSQGEMTADHIIAATGYKVDLEKLSFLDDNIRAKIRCVGTSPALSSYFESSVQNLYFVGVSAANTFGPLLRFAFGAGFAAPRISNHLTRTASRLGVSGQDVKMDHLAFESEKAEVVTQ